MGRWTGCLPEQGLRTTRSSDQTSRHLASMTRKRRQAIVSQATVSQSIISQVISVWQQSVRQQSVRR